MIPHYQWPTSTSKAFDILFHDIPHNAHTAGVIRYRVIYLAAERMINDIGVIEALNSLDDIERDRRLLSVSSSIFQNRKALDIVRNAISLLEQMTQPEYYEELCTRSAKDYTTHGMSSGGGFYLRATGPRDSLVRQHHAARLDCRAIGYLLREYSHTAPIHLPRAIFALGDAVSPKLAGFEGESQLRDMLHGIRYFLDGMDYRWSNEAHIEAIFSYYLI